MPSWAETNKSVRKLRKRLRQIQHLAQRAEERELTLEEQEKVDDEASTRSTLEDEEALFATLEPPAPPPPPEPEPEPAMKVAVAVVEEAEAADEDLAALLGDLGAGEGQAEEEPEPADAAEDDEDAAAEPASEAKVASAAVAEDEDDDAAEEDDAEEEDGEEQEAAAEAQRERLAAVEQAAPAPAAAPSAGKKPPVSAFARRGGRYSVTVIEGHSDGVTGVELLGSRGGTIKWWDAHTGAELKSLGKHKKAIEGLAYHQPSATLATASRDGNVMLWDADGMAHRKSTYIGTALSSLCFLGGSSAVQLLVGGADGRLRLLDAGAGGKVIAKSETAHTEKIGAVACGGGAGPVGSLLASGGGDCVVKLWDARVALSKPPVSSLGSGEEMGPVRSLAFSGADTLLCGDDGNNLKVFDLRHVSRPLRKIRNTAFAHENAQCAVSVQQSGACWPGGGGAIFTAAAELADSDSDSDAGGGGDDQGRTYLSDRLDGCVHVFTPRPSGGWEYRSTLADETGLISSISLHGTAGDGLRFI